MSRTDKFTVVGGGVIGMCAAYYCAKRGLQVTLIERFPETRDGCSFGNAGMIVPSHFTPLAAPGMVAMGLRWMWNPESPFYIKPRFDLDLLSWGWQFWRASSAAWLRRSSLTRPLLTELFPPRRISGWQLLARIARDSQQDHTTRLAALSVLTRDDLLLALWNSAKYQALVYELLLATGRQLHRVYHSAQWESVA